ncbi:MAG: HAD family hydrolase [Acidimicrobiales bacterium]
MTWVGDIGALIFDFDGLILDTETCTYETTAAIFAEHGEALDLGWWHSILGTADHRHWTDVLAERLGRPVDRGALVAQREARRLKILRELPPRTGVVELLDQAEARGIPSAVASSSGLDWVGGHLDRLALRRYFPVVVTRDDIGQDAGRTKPAPDLFLLAAELLGVEPARCVAFEDSPHGVTAAHVAGMAVVAVPGPMTLGLDFALADLVVRSLLDVDVDGLAEAVWED